MKPSTYVPLLFLPVLLLGVSACGDDNGGTGPTGPFDLTFVGDDSFQVPHGGQEIHVVVESSGGEVVASETATVSESDAPPFSFTFSDVLEEGGSYVLKYWIDSNFGGGTAGVCDPPSTDHQWRVDITGVNDDVEVADTHRPESTEEVCDAFAFDLSFTGDATFQGAHGGQSIHVSVVRSSSGVSGGDLVVVTETGTVSSSEDPAFSFSFPGVLARGMEYELEYWIDSNFGGGTEGTCDAPDVDHQWRVGIGPVDEPVSIADEHRPGEVESVCSSEASSEEGGDPDGDSDTDY